MQTKQSRNRGVGRYVSEIVKEFIKISHNHEIILIANDNYNDTEESLKSILGEAKILFWHYREAAQRDVQKDREKFILKLRPDIVWMPSLQEGFDEPTETSVNKTVGSTCIWVSTVHDVIPIIFKEDYLRLTDVHDWYYEKVTHSKNSDYIFTVSEFSKNKISELFPFDKSKIFVIPPAVNMDMFNENVGTKIDVGTKKESKPYILFVGGYNPHKNVERLIQAYSILPKNIQSKYKLLLVGEHIEGNMRTVLGEDNFENVEFLTGISDDALINIYKNSSLFVFPSYAEGFGIPPLEAMACGIPTLTSNAHSLPEVTYMTEAMFDPFDVAQISNKIRVGLTDEVFREKLIANGLARAKHYSWKKSAEYMLHCFEEINTNHNLKKEK